MVYIGGTWDLLHAGNLSILKQARALGDYLIVGIYNDSLASILNSKSKKKNKEKCKDENKNNEGNPHPVKYSKVEFEVEEDGVIDYSYPILSMQERMLSLLGCKYISDVLIDAPYVLSSDFISSLNISVVALDGSNHSNCFKSDVRSYDVDSYDKDGVREGSKGCNEDTLRSIRERGDLCVLQPSFSITG